MSSGINAAEPLLRLAPLPNRRLIWLSEFALIDDDSNNADDATKARALIEQAQSAYLFSSADEIPKRIFPLADYCSRPTADIYLRGVKPQKVAASTRYLNACSDNGQVPIEFAEKAPEGVFPDSPRSGVNHSTIATLCLQSSLLPLPRHPRGGESQSHDSVCSDNDGAVLAQKCVGLVIPPAVIVGPFRSSPHCHCIIDNCVYSASALILRGKHEGGLLSNEPSIDVLIRPGEQFRLEDVPFSLSLCTLEAQKKKRGRKRKYEKTRDDGAVVVKWTTIGDKNQMERDEFLVWARGCRTV